MRQSPVVVSQKRAPTQAPAHVVPKRASGRARPAARHADADQAARIREVAYGLYEARGRSDGHDVEDWLAAEASLRGDPVKP